ncbi:MAG: hypothetical protein NTZ33_08420 [Bacteroidetes bacterium]|nr:hypothetical protein [Bacteroidota bacterium]
MIKKTILIAILFSILLINYNIKAQETTKNIEQITLTLYLQKDYNKLIEVGELAISEGVDYFYLRYRIGVAYYSNADYRMAAYHFEKAFEFNTDDPANQQYLYYSYLLSGRTTDANYFTTKMNDVVINNVRYKKKYINSIYVESGVSKSNNIARTTAFDINGPANIYGETDLNSDIFYGHLGMKHDITPRLSIYHGFSHLNIDKRRIICIFDKDTTINYNVSQNEYYINADYQLKNGLKITPAFHYIHVNTVSYMLEPDTVFFNNSKILNSEINVSNYVVSLALTKELIKASVGIFGTYSNLNKGTQIEGGLSLTYFPFGNLDLYSNTNLTCFFQKKSSTQGQGSIKETRLIFDQMIGFKVFSKLWTEASVTIGQMENYNEKNAFIVYNIPDVLKFKAGLSLIYSLSEKIELSLRYQLLSKESTYYTQLDLATINSYTVNYQNNTIIGGLKWTL